MAPVPLVHAALVLQHFIFGCNPIIGKLGVKGANPMLFMLVRQSVAGPLMMALAAYTQMSKGEQLLPSRKHFGWFCVAAFFVSGNQCCGILAMKLSTPVTVAAWQPTQAVWTALISYVLGLEACSWKKVVGMLISISGAMFIVLWGAEHGSSKSQLIGQFCAFGNCLGVSCYVITARKLLAFYPPAMVTGAAHVIASFITFCLTYAVSLSPTAAALVCTDSDPAVVRLCMDQAWRIPSSMVPALAWFIIAATFVAYMIMTWATKYVKASVVSIYTVVQPAATDLISGSLVYGMGAAWATQAGIRAPGLQTLGVIPILLGLLFIAADQSTKESEAASNKGERPEHPFRLSVLLPLRSEELDVVDEEASFHGHDSYSYGTKRSVAAASVR